MTSTSALAPADLRRVRELMDASFADFDDHDWQHALGGVHALVREGADVVAHAALVPRRLVVGGRALRCGYVEAVAVRLDRRRRGLGGQVMAELEARASSHDLLALCASSGAVPFYLARGWRRWEGPTSVQSSAGPVPTPDEDGAVFVLPGTVGALDLRAPITCDARDGDVW